MDKPICILHLEDDQYDAELVKETLAAGNIEFQLSVVQTREGFRDLLLTGDFDIILSDYNLPSFDGLSALQMVKDEKLDIPLIFVSGKMGEDAAIETLTQGATDYVLKNKLSRLVPAVNRAYQELLQKRKRDRIEQMMQIRLRIFEKVYSSGITLDEACTMILDEIESQTSSSIGFFHFVDENQQTIQLQAWSTNTKSVASAEQGKGAKYDIHEAGLWSEIIHSKKPVIYNDYSSFSYKNGLPEGHAPVVREVIVPIIRSGLVVAVVGVGNKATDYDMTDTQIISLLGDLSWEIIERIKTEEALRKSEERYRMVFESSPVSIWEEDFSEVLNLMNKLKSEGVNDFEAYLENHPEFVRHCVEKVKVCDVNQAAILLHDAPNKESLLGDLSQLFSPENFDAFRQQLIFLWNGETEITIDGIINTLSGRALNVTLFFTVCPGYEKTYAKTLVSIVDITERKQTEETLRKLSHIVEQSPVSIVLTDNNGITEYVNPKFISISGFHPTEVVGKKPATLLKIEKDIDTSTKIQQQISSGNEWKGELQLQKKNGELYWEHITISPICDKTGETKHLMIIKEDITEQKNLEDRIRQTEKLEAIGQLVGGVAHDFNNMLHIILGLCQIELKKHNPTQLVHKHLTEIHKAAQRAADITRQLLAFARKQAIVPVSLDLNGTIEGLIKMLKRLIGENIELNLIPGDDLEPILIDPSQIDQILVNLCVNARDAITDVGKITIRTKKAVFDEVYCDRHPGAIPGEYNQIVVSDTGSGMDDIVLSKLFEPFFTTKEPGKGTGLGLATVYGIVKQNNGFILVESKPGDGTTFMISLPILKGPKAQEHKDEQPHKATKGSDTIILVEDEPVLINIVKKMLEQFGYKVIAASKPSDAVEIAKEHTSDFHLLLTDVVMPEMNGFELAKLIRKIHPEIRCIFMSGYPNSIIGNLGEGNVGGEILQKPFTMQALAARLNNLL